MDFNCFQRHDLFILFPSLACLIASIVLYANAKEGKLWPAMLFLTIAALGLRVFMAHLDPFLWDWDERYHALVAKNFLLHPLKPTLYDHPVLAYNYVQWDKNYIWMHKQPMAMWQMALGFYLFGVNQFSARFPMIVEGTLLVLIIFRIGSITTNKQAGYLSALIFTVSYYALGFMTGGEVTDHVDYALTFYTSATLWTWIEYRRAAHWKWLLLTGIFAGLAVLSKWVTGLLVYIAWGIFIISDPVERKKISSYLKLVFTVAISLIIFLPWQIYALTRFPVETRHELNFNANHLFHAVDGRSENDWYYLANLGHNFGVVVPFILLFAMIFMWKQIKRPDYRVFVFSCLVIPYLFFSIIAATKMPAYCYFACAPMFLALGSFALYTQRFIEKLKPGYSNAVLCVALIIMSWFSLNIHGIAMIHTGCDPNNIYRVNKVNFTDYFRKIKDSIPKDYVVFGLPYDVHVEMMFYTGNTCYETIPDINEYQRLKKAGVKMAVIRSDKTPVYLVNDPEVLKIKWL